MRQAPYAGILLRLRRQVSWVFDIYIFRTNYRIEYVLYYVTASFIRANEMFCIDCIYVERPLFQYCEMDTESAYIALAGDSIDTLVTSEHREHFFRTVPTGFRPSAATSTKTTTSRLVSPDSRGQPPRRVASRARRTTRGRPVCSRSSGVATGLLGCAASPTTVSVPPIRAPLKA